MRPIDHANSSSSYVVVQYSIRYSCNVLQRAPHRTYIVSVNLLNKHCHVHFVKPLLRLGFALVSPRARSRWRNLARRLASQKRVLCRVTASKIIAVCKYTRGLQTTHMCSPTHDRPIVAVTFGAVFAYAKKKKKKLVQGKSSASDCTHANNHACIAHALRVSPRKYRRRQDAQRAHTHAQLFA